MKTMVGNPEFPKRWSGTQRSLMARLRMAMENARKLR